MSCEEIWSGIIIGASGGAIAGITVWGVDLIHKGILRQIHLRRVHDYLLKNTEDVEGKRFRSTRTIASFNNLTEDRVRYICSQHKKIVLSTGENEDMWGLKAIVRDNNSQ